MDIQANFILIHHYRGTRYALGIGKFFNTHQALEAAGALEHYKSLSVDLDCLSVMRTDDAGLFFTLPVKVEGHWATMDGNSPLSLDSLYKNMVPDTKPLVYVDDKSSLGNAPWVRSQVRRGYKNLRECTQSPAPVQCDDSVSVGEYLSRLGAYIRWLKIQVQHKHKPTKIDSRAQLKDVMWVANTVDEGIQQALSGGCGDYGLAVRTDTTNLLNYLRWLGVRHGMLILETEALRKDANVQAHDPYNADAPNYDIEPTDDSTVDLEQYRREPTGFTTTPLEGEVDYATAGNLIGQAMHHLDEGIPAGQPNRCKFAFLQMERGMRHLRRWFEAKGVLID